MLKYFRQKHIAKVIFWALVILIMPAFVLWGTGNLSGSRDKGPTYAGIIDARKISFTALGDALVGIRCQILLNYFDKPEAMTDLFKDRAFLVKLAWDRLVMLNEAAKYKIKVPDEEVVNYIRSHPLFERNNIFDPGFYQYTLGQKFGLDARAFEEIVREDLTMKRLNDIVAKDIVVSEEEILAAFRKDRDKFKVLYVLVDPDDFINKVKVDDEAMKDYYEKNKSEFSLPKESENKETPAGFVKFDDVKENIKYHLLESGSRMLAFKEADELHKKIEDLMRGEKKNFETAAAKLGLKTRETPLFSKSDYLDGLGEAFRLTTEAAKLRKGELSNPVEMRRGILIFEVTESEQTDETKFDKEKEEYKAKAVNAKKEKFLEDWLRRLELKTTLKIDFKDYEKYIR